jgi:hypothetical protein
MIKNPLTRSLIWRSMWQQVLDVKLSANDYFAFLMKNLPAEESEDTLKDAMRNSKDLLNFFSPLDNVKD